MPRIFLYLLLLSSQMAGAQLRKDYLFSSLSIRNGLISEETVDVQQDSKGFIWIATVDGLQRYEGRRLLTFRHIEGDSTSMPNDNIAQMRLDKKNRLWLLFNENKVGYINPADLSFHLVPVNISINITNRAITQLIVDDDGNVMLLLYKIGTYAYDEEKKEFNSKNLPRFEVPKTWNPIFIRKDKSPGIYWIACDSGLVKYDQRKKVMYYRDHGDEQDPLLWA
ncbi:MAG: hypothetical protein EOP49_33225, partial [Sphingobacteriales bacterium]